ncbi:MAG: efflux RND transporter periplasmic adaptor subunit, partial [Chthoniobacterales bacterium]
PRPRAGIRAVVSCALALLAISCSKKVETAAGGEKTLYTCSMHPQIIREKPGDCPICGMKLEPIRKQASASMRSQDGVIAVDARTIQQMGVRTALVSRGPLVKDIRAMARIDFNETAVSDINVRESGWIEKVYVDSVGKLVHRGEPLFDFFSPELLVAQKEYLLAIERGSDYAAQTLVKLRNVGISETQVAALQKTRQARQVVQVESPRDGFVVEKNALEGQMVERGMKLYRIADLATVWVFADIYESDLPFLKVGQPATVRLSYMPDRTFVGRVSYIYPTVDEKTRAVRVRMEFANPGNFLKPGMYATAEIHAELSPDSVLVDDAAVLRSGERNTVFVALGDGRFEPRVVSLGARGAGNVYQVLDGLKPGERVVTSAQFLLDSESQLREAVEKMREPSMTGVVSPANAMAASPMPMPDYCCPEPGHCSIHYNHPGKCPICGMIMTPEKTPAVSGSPAPTPVNPSPANAQGDH